MRWDDFCPDFIEIFFQPGRDKYMWWDNICAAFLSVDLSRYSKRYLLVKIINKTTLPNATVRFNSIFLLLFINLAALQNQETRMFSNIYFLSRKAATQNFSCNLLLLSRCEYSEYIVVMLDGFSETTPEEIILVTFFVCCYEFMYQCFNMFIDFGRFFYPAALVGCFLRMLNE